MTAGSRRRERLLSLSLVALGGFAGAAARYAVAASLPAAFPWGTLSVNVAGSFALALLLSEGRLADAVSAEARLLVGTGFLSSFTTYSAFAAETVGLTPRLAVANVGANYALGLLAVLAGRRAARWSP